ncbi:hypothetical protein ACROYT_G042567 [Oculina patagonica]
MSFVLNRASSETFTNARTSFLQLKRWNVSETKGLGFRFKTFLPDALLLYMDDEGQTNFLRVELFHGKLRLTCSHGSRFGAMAVEIGDNLNDLNWHRVLLERNNGKTTISLDNRSKSTINSRERTSLIVKSPMYFGGLPPKLSAHRVTQPSVILLSRFLGCITDIELFEYSSGQGNRRKAIVEDSDGIAADCVDMCEKENKCQNNATCLNRFTTTACDCTATGYRGAACEQALPVLGLSRADHVVFNRSKKSISTQQDRIILRFKTANQNGSLLESGRGRDYLAIELSRGSILIRWNLGSGEIYVHAREKVCSDDKWHSIDVRRNQRQLDLTIDRVFHVSKSFPGRFISFDLKQGEGDVFIGGVGSSGYSSRRRSSGIPFDGCLQEINFNNVDIIQEVINATEAFTTHGRPRQRCEISKDLYPTTSVKTSTTPVVTTEQPTTPAATSAKRVQSPASYTTTGTVTTDDSTNESPRVSTSQSFSGNSVIPCSDDEDDCSTGSGENEDHSGESGSVVEEADIFSAHSGDNNINGYTIPKKTTNNSKHKFLKVLPSKAPKSKTEGETDISQSACAGDDEDGCEDVDESGQGSAEQGSAGGGVVSPTRLTTVSRDNDNNQVKRSVTMKQADGSKKWTLIAGIIVVATLLIAFCVFAIWWLCKNKNNPEWTGMYKGSREKCLQAEITDV